MNKEIIQQLKDAGFKSNFVDGCQICGATTPTLSELIEACGISFLDLRNETGFFGAIGFEIGNRKETMQLNGKTPEEAVANLWLELNKI